MVKIRIGTVELEDAGVEQLVEGPTGTGDTSTGRQRLFSVTDNAGLNLVLADTRWDTGERNVGVLTCEGPPQITSNLVPTRFRMSVQDQNGKLVAALMQARIKLNTAELQAALYPTVSERHDVATGVNVEELLLAHGARTVETDRSRTRVYFREDSPLVPALAFVLTRVLPLKNMAWATGTNHDPGTFQLKGTTDPDGYHCYVIALDRNIAPNAGPLGSVYVGQTGVLIQQRFRQHKLGHRSSRYPKKYGIRLMPELFENLPRLDSKAEAEEAERALAEELRRLGYNVFGGH